MYICGQCGHGSSIKLGKCPACHAFGSFTKDVSLSASSGSGKKGGTILSSSHIDHAPTRYPLDMPELQRVFPDGLVASGVYLLAGEPGIGKSTLALQMLHALGVSPDDIMYCSGEEDAAQIIARMERVTSDRSLARCYHVRYIEDIIATAQDDLPKIVVVDSIQTVASGDVDSIAGSPSQVKYCSEQLSKWAKHAGVTLLIIGHVTKEGAIAGPKYLEHIVDVVCSIEGERSGQYRFLRTKKNRFGSSDEVAIFEMSERGLVAVHDIHSLALDAAQADLPGSVITMGLDNGRPVLLYVEVLLAKMKGKYPQRVTLGIETTRLYLLLAIMEKYLKMPSGVDVFVNIPGEFKGADAGLDVAVIAALWSQRKQKPLPPHTVFLGEVGLAGQVLPAKHHKKRRKELPAQRSCIDHTIISHIRDLGQYIG